MAVDLKNLRTVIEMATRRRDNAGAALAHARSQLRSGQAQLTQLSDYVNEGQEKWINRATLGVTVVLMQHQGEFMEKIHAAIDFQHNVLNQRQTQVESALKNLQTAEIALEKIKKVEQTIVSDKALKHKIIDQKINDEMAMSMLAHQRHQAHIEAQS